MDNLICPKCKTLLSPAPSAKGMLWRCEACSGVAANVAVLRRYLKDDIVKGLWLKAITESTPSDRKCPCCLQMLKEFAAGTDNRRVRLDLCKNCQLMWFDKNELEAFPREEKVRRSDIEQSIAAAGIELEARLDKERSSAHNIASLGIDILFLIIRLLLFR